MIECIKNFLCKIENEVVHHMHNLDKESIQKAANVILESERNGGRVHVTGIGKPGHVAGYIASLLSSTGTSSYELHGTEAVHGSSGQVCKGDVVIAISNSGETLELEATIQALVQNGARIISCTRNRDSSLAKASEVCLVAHVEEEGDRLNKPPRASIIAEIITLQCLSIVLQEIKNVDLKQYVRWHPGGILGKSIDESKKKGR